MKNKRCVRSVCRLLFCLFLLEPFAGSAAAANGEPSAVLTVNLKPAVEVEAKAWVLMDAATGAVLAETNADERLYPASVTKIMTLLLVCEAIETGKLAREARLTCSETAAAKGGSQIWLEPGETMTVDDLLKASFVYSANDACTLLGEAVAGSEAAFVQQMNEKAKQLEMTNTHFDNCTGLDDDTTTHLSTARDIAVMSRALLKYDWIRAYTTIWMDTLRNGETQLVNTNRLIRSYAGATGLKTGTTSKAGCCVAATAERDGLSLIAVVLGAGNSKARFAGAAALLDYGFANYESFLPTLPPAALEPIPLQFAPEAFLPVETAPVVPLLTDRGAAARIETRIDRPETVEAPVEKGQRLGAVSFCLDGETLAEYPILAGRSVRRLTLWDAVMRIVSCVRE